MQFLFDRLQNSDVKKVNKVYYGKVHVSAGFI